MTPKAREESLKHLLDLCDVPEGYEQDLLSYMVTTLVAHEEQLTTLTNVVAKHSHSSNWIKCTHSVLRDSSCTLESGHTGYHTDRDGFMVDAYGIEVDNKGQSVFHGVTPPQLCKGNYHFFQNSRQAITCQCGKTGVLLPEGRVYRE